MGTMRYGVLNMQVIKKKKSVCSTCYQITYGDYKRCPQQSNPVVNTAKTVRTIEEVVKEHIVQQVKLCGGLLSEYKDDTKDQDHRLGLPKPKKPEPPQMSEITWQEGTVAKFIGNRFQGNHVDPKFLMVRVRVRFDKEQDRWIILERQDKHWVRSNMKYNPNWFTKGSWIKVSTL